MPLDYGFLFSTKLENGVVINMSDQDYIHNHKKADRHLDHASRELSMGPYLVHRNILRQLAQNFSPHVHGLRDEDTDVTCRIGRLASALLFRRLENVYGRWLEV